MAVGMDASIQLSDIDLTSEEIVKDYRTAYRSRQASLIGRREVLSGKAKFGIFGDGKEIPQLALARVFQPGDFRSGYYRDQTFMFAVGELAYTEFFAQLYAHADLEAEPATAGRSMNAHFATRSLNFEGEWLNLAEKYNSSADVSPTASQMPRLVGLAYASRLYRQVEELHQFSQFSRNGNEIAFGTIGNASTAEGIFWESINAIGVLKAPAVVSIWDDGFGISVNNAYQILKENLSALLSGFVREPGETSGYDLYTVHGWDYPALLQVYRRAAEVTRREHVPALIHVTELTQPQGHSTSGSQERYKSPERLEWETKHDGLTRFRTWILSQDLIAEEELAELENEDYEYVEAQRKAAWEAYVQPIEAERKQVLKLLEQAAESSPSSSEIKKIAAGLAAIQVPFRRDNMAALTKALVKFQHTDDPIKQRLAAMRTAQNEAAVDRYETNLYRGTALMVPETPAKYAEKAPLVYGFEVVNACFDAALGRDPRVVAFGEDVGHLGDVNQGFKGLQEKYGELRVTDTGIREATILGQAIGLAERGLRPIAEIQYVDYILYALQIMSDDLATLFWRTKGGQKAPVIVRTRGHRLEGIWHSGSPMAALIHLLRGMYVLVPRNMTQAAGFYNLLLQSDEPALVVEVLNGYRLKERLPQNIGVFTVPLGVPEILRTGSDITLVTYGACCRIVLQAAETLERLDIQAEVIDVQTLLPFDRPKIILESLKKTSRILFIDEDMPGGTTAYMLQEVLEQQGGYYWLDSPAQTLSATTHRPAYGSDGDYWSKPNAEQIVEKVYNIMQEVDPAAYPTLF
ncbi:MAG: thiamine pyrophosphate-dependent enzyme [Anaerolineales bacterium]|jgi:pyruvate/2-oxoglutarate/acetoin dehydrogenase E1 component/TPP-dependent pyruvate/acetoin dehydrogenase alpha subunit